MEDFNLMLGDRTSNLRMQAEDENYATIAMNQQAGEFRRVAQRDAANRLSSAQPLQDLDPASRNAAAKAMSSAALEALNSLTPQEQQDRQLRQQTMSDAIRREALNRGITLSEAEANALAANTYGSFENTAVNKFGFESATAAAQVMGPDVVESRNEINVQAQTRAQMNEAMSQLGPTGTMTQRVFDAIQRQGERGEEADLDTLLIDVFGVEDLEARDKLLPELQAIANEKEAIEELQGQLTDPNLSQAEKNELAEEIRSRTEALKQRNIEVREAAREMGYDSGEGSFGRDDVNTARKAAEEIEHLNRLDQSRLLGLEGEVTEEEREAIADTRITREDVYALAENVRKENLRDISELTAEDIETYSTKVAEIEELQKKLDEGGVDEGLFDFTGLDPDEREEIQRQIDQKTAEIIGLSPEVQEEYNRLKDKYGEETALRRVKEMVSQQVGTVDEIAEDIASDFGDTVNRVGLLSDEEQDAIVRSRRSDEARIPTATEIAKRAEELREGSDLTEEDLEIETLKERARDAETFDMGLRRMREAARESLQQPVTDSEAADSIATEATNALLGLDPATLADEEERLEAVKQAITAAAEQEGVALDQETVQRQAENTIKQAELIAKQYGSESLEEFISTAPEESAETIREEVARRQDLVGNQAEAARHQLLAESQLRSLGYLEEGQTLHADADEIESYERLPDELRQALVGAEVGDRAEIVDQFIDSKIEEKFYGTDQEREENRQSAIQYLQSEEGERAIDEHKTNLERMVDLRRELMADPEAVKRLGSARAVEAIDQSRSAEMALQTMANRYGFNGSVEAMLVSEFVGSDAEGMEVIEQEFQDLTDEQREEIAAGLKEHGLDVSADSMSVSDYQVHLRNQMKQHVEDIKDANEIMRGAADNKQRAEELGLTEEQFSTVEKLAGMEKAIEEDAEEYAEKIGISEEEYWDMATGAQEFDENLKLFDGEKAAENLEEAKRAETNIFKAEERLKDINESIASIEEAGGTPSDALLMVQEEQQAIIAEAEAVREEKMKMAGFDPAKEADVARYQQLLDSQGDVSMLEERSKDYQSMREKLREEGKTEEEINTAIDKIVAEDKAADERLAELKKHDISYADVQLAEALGIDTTTASEELKEFKALVKESGGTSDASKRTQKMVAESLTEVDRIKGLEGEDAFQKLDTLTDEYQDATPKERKALAQKYGMDVDELDHLMRKTEFLGLENVDLSDMDDKERQEVLAEGLERVMGRDIESEVKSEEERQLTLKGTVNLTGVVQGEGTFDDVTGHTVR